MINNQQQTNMKNVIFEKLKKEFNIQNDDNLKLYSDAIWQVYKANNIQNDFEKTINAFLKKFEKADKLYSNEYQIYFLNYGEIDDESFKKALKVTNWNNFKKVEKHKFNTIDINKIYLYQTYSENEFDMFILEDIQLFTDIYIYCFKNLFYN